MEKFNDWIIYETDVTSWFLQSGQVKLHAKIYPNIETLHDFLRNNDIYKAHLNINGMSIQWNFSQMLGYGEMVRNREIANALYNFCNTTVYETTKKGYAYLDTGGTGTSRTRKRAMNKIKDWIRQNLPNPRTELIKYLKKEKLISSNVNPFCEILNKDI